jgi:hypothetical protein
VKENAQFLIESVLLELEYRENYMSVLSAQKKVDTCLANIYIQKDNIVDLLIAQDISDNALFEIQNISTDKRCLRDHHSFYINAFDFEPLSLRLFTINDVIQIKIKDV